MDNGVLIVGEQSLLKLKLMSILSRRIAVFSVNTLEEVCSFLREGKPAHIIFCSRLVSVRGRKICLIDEAIFTGATLQSICARMREYGASELHVLLPTPPCTAQCRYCSIPTRPMLLETIPQSSLAKKLGADSVSFQSRETFEQVLRGTGLSCSECFHQDASKAEYSGCGYRG